MVSVVYEAPDSIDGAISLLANADIPAKILAGGTDLIIQTNGSNDESRLLVDIKRIAGMLDAELTADGLDLGPSMSCAEFTARDDIKKVFPGLVEAAYLIGSTQVQGRASLGGTLLPPILETIFKRHRDGLDEFFVLMFSEAVLRIFCIRFPVIRRM